MLIGEQNVTKKKTKF